MLQFSREWSTISIKCYVMMLQIIVFGMPAWHAPSLSGMSQEHQSTHIIAWMEIIPSRDSKGETMKIRRALKKGWTIVMGVRIISYPEMR